ncbi:MAG: glycosyltransferase family 2 protein [Ruminococcus sp.]|nr:glycosyltransferase family 2 protein [Ruminococcus sp.]
MDKKELISFVIPCYNSMNSISAVVDEIDETMELHNEYNYEVVLVNDSSPDDVWSVIKKLAESKSYIKAISLAKNFGQHSALMAGYRACEGDIIVSADDDGQTPVNQVFRMIDVLNDGNDVVYARYGKIKQSFGRRLGTWINGKMNEILLGKPKGLFASSYFVMKRFVARDMIKYNNPYPYIGGLVFRTTKKIVNVDVDHREREEGKSGYSLGKLIKLWMNGFTAFSVVPLRFSSLVGVICAIIGFIFGLVTVIRKLVVPNISVGWSSTIAIMLFVGGLIMLMLGMIGEYIGRIYISLNNAPQYVVKETVNIEEE